MTSRSKWIAAVVGGAWLAGMLVATPFFIRAHRERDAALGAFSKFASALQAGQDATAYNQTGHEFHSAVSLQQFLDLQSGLRQRYGRLNAVKQIRYNVSGEGNPISWTGAIDSEFEYERGAVRFELVFHKDGNSWVLYALREL